jgi:hypothetical protein
MQFSPVDIDFFKSLFHGSQDIYAIRWEKAGKSGYMPRTKLIGVTLTNINPQFEPLRTIQKKYSNYFMMKLMSKDKKTTFNVIGTEITILSKQKHDFISLSGMVRNFEGGSALIEQWLRNKDTIEFLAVWEQINNPDFNSLEFEGIKREAGTNRFYLSAKKWIETTNAIGLIASARRYGGTFAHKDIAFEFGSWLSPEFKLYLLKEFRCLKDDENQRLSLEWNLHRILTKINYRIHTDAIKENIITTEVTKEQAATIYASEADMLNVAMFGENSR